MSSSEDILVSAFRKGIITLCILYLGHSCTRYTNISPTYLLWNRYITRDFFENRISQCLRREPRPYLVKQNQANLVQWDSGVGFVLEHNSLTYFTTVMFCTFKVCCEGRKLCSTLKQVFRQGKCLSFEIGYIFLSIRIYHCSKWL